MKYRIKQIHRWCKEGKLEVHTWNPETYR